MSIYFWGNYFKTEQKKKRIEWICFIKITSILGWTQLSQAVKHALIFCHEILKIKFFSSLMLKNFSSHLTWKLSWTPFHKWSPLFQETWTRLSFPLQNWFTIVHCRLWNMVHGNNLNWNRCISHHGRCANVHVVMLKYNHRVSVK